MIGYTTTQRIQYNRNWRLHLSFRRLPASAENPGSVTGTGVFSLEGKEHTHSSLCLALQDT